MSDHGTFDELAVGYALHALEPEDEAVFAVHLPTCPRCAATVAETGEVMAALAADLPAAEPPDEVRIRLRAAVAATEQRAVPAAPRPGDDDGAGPAAAPAAPTPERPPVWRRVLPGVLVAAAVATILGLGLWNVVLAQSRDELRATVAEQEAVVTALLRPGRATVATLDGDGRPVATVVARSGELQVITHGLSVNEADTTSYVVWGLGGDEPEALGTFDVGRSQMDLLTVGSRATGLDGLDGYAEYAISLEPGQEAPSRPTVVVAKGEVAS
jgi:anti-sigma-K factor RskA